MSPNRGKVRSFTPTTFPAFWIYSAAVFRRNCWRALPHLAIKSIHDITSAHRLFICSLGALTVRRGCTVPRLCEQSSLSQPASEDGRPIARGASVVVCSLHSSCLRQSDEPKPAVTDHGCIIDMIPVRSMFSWVHKQQEGSTFFFAFCARFIIRIGRKTTNFNSLKNS